MWFERFTSVVWDFILHSHWNNHQIMEAFNSVLIKTSKWKDIPVSLRSFLLSSSSLLQGTWCKFNLLVKVYLLDSAILKGALDVNECFILCASSNRRPFECLPHLFLPFSTSSRKKSYILKEEWSDKKYWW